jgi:hypothetical protein
MARDKTDKTDLTPATSAMRRKVRGLLDVMDAEVNGQAWVLDSTDALAGIGLGLGASQEARELALVGLFSRCIADIDKKLADLEPKKGRPKVIITIDVRRAAAVLGADDLWRDKTGAGAQTQKAAIELATQIDRILCEAGERETPLFSNMITMKRFQDSVSNGLRELGVEDERFLK